MTHRTSIFFFAAALALPVFAQKVDFPTQVMRKTYADMREYGVNCSNTTSVTNTFNAMVSAGKTHITLPANCTLIPTSNTIPAGIDIMGEDWTTSVISSSDPSITGNWLSLGSKSVVRNVGIKHRFCTELASPAATLKVCPVGFAQNIGDSAVIMNNWAYVPLWMSHGPTNGAANDIPGPQIVQRSYGDGFYASTTAAGIAYRSEVKSDDGGGGIGLLALVEASGSPAGTGVYAKNQSTNSNSSAITVEHTNTGGGLVFVDASSPATSGNEITATTAAKTSGSFLNLFQATSTYAGNAIQMNLGYGTGSFTGKFLNLAVNDAEKFSIGPDGRTFMSGVAHASLGTPGNGTFIYCTDCNVATPCTSGGSGAWAFRAGGQWKCPF